ncbi:hypothetical protein V2E25_00305 [Mycoplasmopsis arginini]|uniref:Uncharacterized protein n=1 Tax=Mycoplasmopsis arginini TaxID=2094 RepID=A0ABZ2AJD2_MYCAR|nr:hypothetical protein [Mycoplasmopsis arginini]MDP4042961.1 hypothetical protein [Mycoplasmopsis arginini]PWC08737.1 hypothetical protein DIE66_02385 [Mycoplasmopsis arginini]WVN22033.1 hypothetical protein V2E25_00305 [Mycoplasmopsis arginini]VEU81437.1 Uncharacterised protein [Mycoplasmopsis arginini]
MDYKNFSSLNNQTKTKKVAKKVLRVISIMLVVIVGLIMLGFIIYGLIWGVYKIFNQDTLRLF